MSSATNTSATAFNSLSMALIEADPNLLAVANKLPKSGMQAFTSEEGGAFTITYESAQRAQVDTPMGIAIVKVAQVVTGKIHKAEGGRLAALEILSGLGGEYRLGNERVSGCLFNATTAKVKMSVSARGELEVSGNYTSPGILYGTNTKAIDPSEINQNLVLTTQINWKKA
ncbi:MAG: hypothetical protein S4CHLAM2_16060 [Chlamydiales bacterium]|nr:hypothetical protein [Chlamydiales bacterium]